MKKIVLILICLIIVGCQNNNENEITMKIKKGTLSNTNATIIITDNSNENHVYGLPYKIEKKENGTWKELKKVTKENNSWNDIGYNVGSNKKLELEINWEWLYGKLEKGTYKLTKETFSKEHQKKIYLSTEFTI